MYVSDEVFTKDGSLSTLSLSHTVIEINEYSSLSQGHQVTQGPPHKESESLASLYNQIEWAGSENENLNQDHKNSQLSNAQDTKSLKLKLIKCAKGPLA
jgi:hypothetical protein